MIDEKILEAIFSQYGPVTKTHVCIKGGENKNSSHLIIILCRFWEMEVNQKAWVLFVLQIWNMQLEQ